MRLSIAVIAMSNLPSMRLVSWNTELGVGVIFTSMPCLSKKPFSLATQIGQLNPPGKTIRLTVCSSGGAAGATAPFGEAGARDPEGPPAQDSSSTLRVSTATVFSRCMSPPLKSASVSVTLWIVLGQLVPHSLGDSPLPGRPTPRLLLVHPRRLLGEPRGKRGELHAGGVLEEHRERHRLLRVLGAGHRAVDVHQ